MSGSFALALRYARRELRGGLRGFWIFLACLTLGVGAIAAVQSVSRGVTLGLREDGREILGGDIAARQIYRPVTQEQLALFESLGDVTLMVDLRAMALPVDGSAGPGAATLVDLKAVDDVYPLYGEVGFADGSRPLAATLAGDGTVFGGAAESLVLDRLGLEIGDRVTVGEAVIELRDIITHEPDRASGGSFAVGPRLLISMAALEASGLIQPGSLLYYTYRIGLDSLTPAQAMQEIETAYPDAGWRVRDYTNASPQLSTFISRLTLFLTMTGLTALLVGGVGVGNAVRAYLEGKVETIATLKTLGAPGGLIFNLYVLQILALAVIGISVGLAVGAIAPLIVADMLDQALPITTRIAIFPEALMLAGAFGVVAATTFSLWPVGRAREIPAAALFRDALIPAHVRPRLGYRVATIIGALALCGLALASTDTPQFAIWFVLGAGGTLAIFALAARAIKAAAARLPRARRPDLRLAIANLHRPGAPTVSIALSLGLGLTVLVTIALIEGNFDRAVEETLPRDAPAFFFVDIQPDQLDGFKEIVTGIEGTGNLRTTPSLRGRIVRVNDRPAEEAIVDPSNRWVLNGDRGISHADSAPPNDDIIAGEWWAEGYDGPPRVAIADAIAEAFGIGPGDFMTFEIVGRELTAEVAAVRDIEWGTVTLNFSITLNSAALAGAPQTHLATLHAPAEAEAAVQRAVVSAYPNITAISVRDALDTINDVLTDIAAAVRGTAAVTLIAGTLVLAGAVAAGHRRRVYDAVVLKVLGATRADVTRSFLLEFGLIGLIVAAIAAVVGALCAWAVIRFVMDMGWVLLPGAILTTTLLCTAITLGFGYVGTWRALGQKAAPLLRNE